MRTGTSPIRPRPSGNSRGKIREALAWQKLRPDLVELRRGAQAGHHQQALDLAVLKRGEELVVVPDRGAAVRIAVRTQHVAVGQQPVAAERALAVGRNHAERLN